ncbi:MAG: stage 0 sporulation protein [bacterium]|nr:stage 0 sporulation protein [bacterium]
METNVIRVRLLNESREFHVPSGGIVLDKGDLVIIDTDDGLECCRVTKTADLCVPRDMGKPEGTVLRKATPNDIDWIATVKDTEKRAEGICRELIEQQDLQMNLFEVKQVFDGSKLIFYFTADDRVDFRGLVRDLAREFHIRIEMRQIGVRDKARQTGAVAICGRELCCSSHLKDFMSVTMKMAKEQNLTLSPNKISGCCGRLLCCLSYENEQYAIAQRGLPTVGSRVTTPNGEGTVRNIQVLTGKLHVALDTGGYVSVHRDEVEIVKLAVDGGKRSKAKAAAAKNTEKK